MTFAAILKRFRDTDPAVESPELRELRALRRQNVQIAQSGSKVMATMAGMLQIMAEDERRED